MLNTYIDTPNATEEMRESSDRFALFFQETGDIELRVFPLGTGNDLSRVLGHGPGHTGPVDAHQVIDHLNELVPVKLDRWSVTVSENLSKSAQMKKFLTGFKVSCRAL